MSAELRGVAERLARELAARDWRAPRGGPPTGESSGVAAPSRHHSDAPPSGPPPVPTAKKASRIADFIDHTLLKAEATAAEIDTLCDEAATHHFAAVCVNPAWVERCARRLAGADVEVASVIGFPLGASTTDTKAFEAAEAVRHGATELDMVAAVGHIKGADWRHVHDDIAAVVRAGSGRVVKVIIESAALTPVEIIKASAIAREAGAHFVKTSTGFHPSGGASAEAVALMRLVVGDALGVKASGGVRDCPTALRMIASGATRIGTSSGVTMSECLGRGPLPLSDLLSLATTHEAACSSASCDPAPASSPRSY